MNRLLPTSDGLKLKYNLTVRLSYYLLPKSVHLQIQTSLPKSIVPNKLTHQIYRITK